MPVYHDLDRDLAHTGKLTDSKCTTVFQVLYDKNLNGPGRKAPGHEPAQHEHTSAPARRLEHTLGLLVSTPLSKVLF